MIHFELIEVWAGPVKETKTFREVSLQMLVYRKITFRHLFYKKLHYIQLEQGSGSGTALLILLPTSTSTSLFGIAS